jgi:hypothetical protein
MVAIARGAGVGLQHPAFGYHDLKIKIKKQNEKKRKERKEK